MIKSNRRFSMFFNGLSRNRGEREPKFQKRKRIQGNFFYFTARIMNISVEVLWVLSQFKLNNKNFDNYTKDKSYSTWLQYLRHGYSWPEVKTSSGITPL